MCNQASNRLGLTNLQDGIATNVEQAGWKSRITQQTLQVIPERSRIASMQFKVASFIRNSHPYQTD